MWSAVLLATFTGVESYYLVSYVDSVFFVRVSFGLNFAVVCSVISFISFIRSSSGGERGGVGSTMRGLFSFLRNGALY